MTGVDATPHVRLSMRGELDAANACDGLALVMRANPCPGDVVTLDLSDVDFIDSSGIAMLLKIRSYLDGMGCRFALVNPSAPVVRVLVLVGLNETFLTGDA